MPKDDEEISLKGLDEFSARFLFGDRPDTETEYVQNTKGQKASDEAINKYLTTRKIDFMRRSTSFTKDLIGFIMEQRTIRNLTDTEAIFGIALANINLRNAYGSPQGEEKDLTPEEQEKLFEEFDEICAGAQDYWDAHS